jgi:hypothetical protein
LKKKGATLCPKTGSPSAELRAYHDKNAVKFDTKKNELVSVNANTNIGMAAKAARRMALAQKIIQERKSKAQNSSTKKRPDDMW